MGWLLRKGREEMTKVGDKFVLEVEAVFRDQSDPNTKLYKMKGFNSLVFDENGIEKLAQYLVSREEYSKIFELGYKAALSDLEDEISHIKMRYTFK